MKLTFDAYNEIVEIKDLKDSEFQRNKHPDEQIILLAKIMETEGVTHPIHVSRNTGNICFGHGRKQAALLNGWEKFPVVYHTFKDRDQEYRMVQSDNGIAHYAELDYAKINADLQDFGPFDIELLAIKDFVVEPAEKYCDVEKPKKEASPKTIICPECGSEFEL